MDIAQTVRTVAELRELAQEGAAMHTETMPERIVCDGLLWALDEIERLRADTDEDEALRERLAELLTGVALALRGPPPPLTRWSWHDLPDRAAAAIAAIDVMQRA